MLKKEIKYEDWDGVPQSEIFYFNLSKPELVDMEFEVDGGMSRMLERMVEAPDNRALVELFKDFILRSVGRRSEDGKRFIKSDEIRTEFTQTKAYEELYMELISSEDAAATFIKGVMPKDLAEQMDKQIAELAKAASAPPTPPLPPS